MLSDSWKCCSVNRICSNNDEAGEGRHNEERNKVYFPKNASAVGLLYYRKIYLLNIFVRFTSFHSFCLYPCFCSLVYWRRLIVWICRWVLNWVGHEFLIRIRFNLINLSSGTNQIYQKLSRGGSLGLIC